MSESNETIETWNKLAQRYEEKFMDLEIYNTSYDFLCSQITNPRANVLELGCGPGMIAKYLLSKHPHLEVLGTDVAPNMVELASSNVPNATFQQLDARNIAALNQTFDVIVSGFCIPYLSPTELEQFVSDCAKALTRNGLLYLSFVPGETAQSAWQTGSSGDRVFFHFHSENSVLEMFAAGKLHFLKRFIINYSKTPESIEEHLVLIATKQ